LKESIQGSHYDIAKLLYAEYCTEFVCASISNKIWFQYKNHHWEEIEEGVFLRNHISTDIVSRFADYGGSLFSAVASSDKAEEKTFQERIKQTNKMISNLKSAPYKTCIMREAADLFFDKNFYKKLDTNPYLIAFKNGVYDLNENIFRNGKPEDYISKSMPINYVNFNETDDRIFAVHDFLQKIFPDTSVRQYFLDQASDVFLGGNQQKVVLFWTGEGDNGKSVTQNIFEKMLGEYAIKFSTTLLTGKKVANGAANPELARAGGGVRWAVLEEPDGDEEAGSDMSDDDGDETPAADEDDEEDEEDEEEPAEE
jgi:phage/plasmid-associated DNA primase